MIMAAMENFYEGIKDTFLGDLIESMRESCIIMYENIFGQVSDAATEASNNLAVKPSEIFPEAYKIVEEISDTAFIPIAGIILACILCYECVNMLVESNRMREFGPQEVFIMLIKMAIGIMLLTHSFDIVNGMFTIGQWAMKKVASAGPASVSLDVIQQINECNNVLKMLGFLVIALFVKVFVFVFTVALKLVVWLRFAELYMFIVCAPLPFSTFLNKEWGQMGYNYIRKILSLAFQPIFMIICFYIFEGALRMGADTGFTGGLFKAMAAMCILTFALFKTRTISDSIFNAH